MPDEPDYAQFLAGLVVWGRASNDRCLPKGTGRVDESRPIEDWTPGVQKVENALVLLGRDIRRDGRRRVEIIKHSYVFSLADHHIGIVFRMSQQQVTLYREESERLAFDVWINLQ